MAHINLLPWREELRKQKEKDFYQFLGIAVVFAAVIMLGIHVHYSGLIENQQSRNAFMNDEIKKVEAKIKEIQELEKKRKQLVSRMRVIERLQSNRPEIVHIFEEFVKVTPDGLYITSLKQKDDMFVVTGVAQSNARVSKFMRSLDESVWFQEPRLEVISSEVRGRDLVRRFTLQVKQTRPKTGEE